MSLHEPCLVWKVWKGSEFLLHWWKLKFTLEDEAALESHFPRTKEEEDEEEEGNKDIGTKNKCFKL